MNDHDRSPRPGVPTIDLLSGKPARKPGTATPWADMTPLQRLVAGTVLGCIAALIITATVVACVLMVRWAL